MMTHEDYKEMITAQALRALDAEDARSLATHLETCAECRAEMSGWESTVAMLAFEAQPLEPSTRVREQILAAVRAEGRQSSPVQTEDVRADYRKPGQPRVDPTLLPFERPRKNVWVSFGAYGAIAAALALVALIISLLGVWQQKRAATAEVARLSSEMRATQQQLAHEREVLALITSPGAHMSELNGTKVAPGAHAMIAYDKTGQAMLMAKDLPPAPAGKAYQLWFIKAGKPMPGSVFTTDQKGSGSMHDQIPAEAMSGAVFAITLEPASGVQAPTGAIYLSSGA